MVGLLAMVIVCLVLYELFEHAILDESDCLTIGQFCKIIYA
jgi:hypothetical protein